MDEVDRGARVRGGGDLAAVRRVGSGTHIRSADLGDEAVVHDKNVIIVKDLPLRVNS